MDTLWAMACCMCLFLQFSLHSIPWIVLNGWERHWVLGCGPCCIWNMCYGRKFSHFIQVQQLYWMGRNSLFCIYALLLYYLLPSKSVHDVPISIFNFRYYIYSTNDMDWNIFYYFSNLCIWNARLSS